MTRLKLHHTITFHDDNATKRYENSRDAVVGANRMRDECIRYETEYSVPGLVERSMVYGHGYVRPWWLGVTWYWVAVLLFQVWPYRLLVKVKTEKVEFQIVKIIFNH